MKIFNLDCLVISILLISTACGDSSLFEAVTSPIPHESRWGIYALDIDSSKVDLIYGSENEIVNMQFSPAVDRFAFSQKVDGVNDEDSELFSIGADGRDLQRLTHNHYMDTYPVWSPDGSQIAFLAWPEATLDIHIMDADGNRSNIFYDSGSHDADIDWKNDVIAFTSNSRIWVVHTDGSGFRSLTDPPRAGEWGKANLPYGDYDPRISPDGKKIVFERLIGDSSPHGNYDLFSMDSDGSHLEAITNTGFSQGLASWSPSGEKIAYIISAKDDVGLYDLFLIDLNGTKNRNITPTNFPNEFLVKWVSFSGEEDLIYFIGEWFAE
jgi:Tol biopolymer transport system component